MFRSTAALASAPRAATMAPSLAATANAAVRVTAIGANSSLAIAPLAHVAAVSVRSLHATTSASAAADLTDEEREILNGERMSMNYDVVIVGAGPSGLSAAIRLKQLAAAANEELNVCVVEKGAEVGAHILSGAVVDPKALNELIPDWQEKGAPLNTPAGTDKLYWFTSATGKIKAPITPPSLQNHGNYVVSLGNVCRWLGEQAEELGVEIFPGFGAREVVYTEDGAVKGIATNDMGVGKDGKPTGQFERGMELHAPVTLFAEGCRGSLTKTLLRKYSLDADCSPQTYGIGLKEVWRVDKDKHRAGEIVHAFGWPLDSKTYGGSFMYHLEDDLVSVGFVAALDYQNAYFNPYRTFQQLKTHPVFSEVLEGGECLAYGARALNEGGFQSIPKLTFPGGALVGCAAGFLNVPKIKGSHTAMKSGMLGAEAAFEALQAAGERDPEAPVVPLSVDAFQGKMEQSWVWEELRAARNVRPSFKYGMYAWMGMSALSLFVTRGKEPWTLTLDHKDHETLKPIAECEEIVYPKPDGKLTFDLLTNLARSGTNHEENQPAHLTLVDDSVPVNHNLKVYGGPEARFCPAGVYEFLENEDGTPRLQINAQNCLHCKTCDIRDPTQNINWVTPEGGGGPAYPFM